MLTWLFARIKGGNAIDAVVASGFALNLLEPHNNSLGGEVPILIHSAKEGKLISISGHRLKVTAPWDDGRCMGVYLDRKNGVISGAVSPRGLVGYVMGD